MSDTYTRKMWVNKEDIPESELGQHPRFDAENMNRIESGIAKVIDSTEIWTFTLEDGSTVTKVVRVG